MIRTSLHWMRTHKRRAAAIALAAVFLIVNAFAFIHARAMTHFAPAGVRTASPESMLIGQKARILLTGVRNPRPANLITPADRDLPFQTHRFPSADGITLEAWLVPALGRARGTCILFHGYTGAKASLISEAAAMRRMGYDALLVDFRGSGGSTGDDTTIGYAEADDVAAAVAFARAKLAPASIVLYGQSMGSAAILRAVADKGVTPDAIVIECPFDRLLSTVRNRFDLMGVPPLGLDRLLVFWGGVQQGYWAFGHAPVEYARRVRCRTLLLQGALDPRVTPAQARSIFDALAGEKRLVIFEGVSHEAYLQHSPTKWENAVGGFLMPG